MKYLYDGSLDGLFTIIFDNYKNLEDISIGIDSDQLDFLESLYIKTNKTKALRVRKAIIKDLGRDTLADITRVFRSAFNEKEVLIAKWLKLSLRYKHIFINSSNDLAIRFRSLAKAYGRELHKYKGFLRFTYLDNDYLFAKIEPENYILEDIAKFFLKRMPNESFVIYDEPRKKAFISDKARLDLIDIKKLDIKSAKGEDDIKDLWVMFFESVSIKERESSKRQRGNMPKKYRKNMPEKNHLTKDKLNKGL